MKSNLILTSEVLYEDVYNTGISIENHELHGECVAFYQESPCSLIGRTTERVLIRIEDFDKVIEFLKKTKNLAKLSAKEKLFAQPTKIGTKVYAYSRYENGEFGRKVYDIVHLNLEGKEEFLKCLNFGNFIDKNISESEMKNIVEAEVSNVVDILDIGAYAGQEKLKEGLIDYK